MFSSEREHRDCGTGNSVLIVWWINKLNRNLEGMGDDLFVIDWEEMKERNS